jgi:hypothetical protein
VQGSTLKHDGTKVVLFTKKELRALDGPIGTSEGEAEAEEGEEPPPRGERGSGGGGSSSGAPRRPKATGGSVAKGQQKPARRPGSGRGGRRTFRDLQQQAMDEYVPL